MTTDSTASKEMMVTPIAIGDEMKSSYLDYAMSVIVSRALPDVRDGLKPVHRRILYTMKTGGYTSDKPYRKSARIVGDVMGKYHPHGDSAIYDALVRMGQDFSLRLMLIDKQGNFGSMDGDPPAAMRYTEARLSKAAETLLADIEHDTVNFRPNYDESTDEPVVLPAEFPNLLVNGAGGIAVGMATNIPTHNLGEVIDGTLALIDNPSLEILDLMSLIKGPDFPTGALILGHGGIASAFATGRGSIMMRARTEREENGNREAIIVTEIPYQVNKSRLLEKIADVVREKQVEGISDLRDESNREGVRIVIELKKDAEYDVVLNQLFKFTPLQTSFGCNMLALDQGKPLQMNLKQILQAFIDFREEVISRRTAFQLSRARDRAHILVGLAIAVANLDEVIALIRAAKDPEEAKQKLLARDWSSSAADIGLMVQKAESLDAAPKIYRLSEVQTKAILDLRLQKLTGLEREKISAELDEIIIQIDGFLKILGDRDVLLNVMRDELRSIRERFATPRRTEIVESEFEHDIEDLIQREDMVVTVSHNGYIKRVPLSTYRMQNRGGRGRAGMTTREDDVVRNVFIASTHTPVLFFTSKGQVYDLKVYKLPMGAPQALGKPIINLLPVEKDETVSAVMALPEDEQEWDRLSVMFATSSGSVRRNRMTDFTNIRAGGKIAMKLEGNESLVAVQPCHENQDILLIARGGKCIRFPVSEVRVFASRNSTGIRGINLAEGDVVMGMSVLEHVEIDIATRERYFRNELPADEAARLAAQEQFIITVSENGYGKRTSAYEYRTIGRGGVGIANLDVTDKTGNVITSFPVNDRDQVVIVTDRGKIIRCPVKDVRIAGRQTQGVILVKTEEGERVVSAARLVDENGSAAAESSESGDSADAAS